MVHINPRISFGFPSAMSSFLMLTSLTWEKEPEVILVRSWHVWVMFSGFSRSHMSYLPVFQEVQCYLYILQFVESHAAFFSGLRRTEKRILKKRFSPIFKYITYLHFRWNDSVFNKMERWREKETRWKDVTKKLLVDSGYFVFLFTVSSLERRKCALSELDVLYAACDMISLFLNYSTQQNGKQS